LGQKVHPVGFRLGIIRSWDGRWYAEKEYPKLLHEDIRIRRLIQQRLADASVPRVEIERSANNLTVTVHTAKPGIVIGRAGAKVEDLRQTARSIAEQLERRVSFRRAMKQAVLRSMQRGAKGVKVVVAGRLGGAEMSRREREVSGKVPLHTLRADIDYGTAEAHTTFGLIGVKTWIYRGDVITGHRRETPTQQTSAAGTVSPAGAAGPAATAAS
jgi:small subunit ribosomal protein S3